MEQEDPAAVRDDARLLFQVSANEIESHKSRQWQVLHLALIADAAIYALRDELGPDNRGRIFLVMALLLLALLVLGLLEWSIRKCRARLDASAELLTEAFRTARSSRRLQDDDTRPSRSLLVFFAFLLFVAAILAAGLA